MLDDFCANLTDDIRQAGRSLMVASDIAIVAGSSNLTGQVPGPRR
jgi:hypothetical protein